MFNPRGVKLINTVPLSFASRIFPKMAFNSLLFCWYQSISRFHLTLESLFTQFEVELLIFLICNFHNFESFRSAESLVSQAGLEPATPAL